MVGEEQLWRIGELSRRVGVSAETLRAWEQRYGLLQPVRSRGNYRLYGSQDEARVRRMLAHLTKGLAASEAAKAALSESSAGALAVDGLAGVRAELHDAFAAFDPQRANALLDRGLATVSTERALRELILPVLHEVGERWAEGVITVAEEHFASALIHARLLALAGAWTSDSGPRAVLACPTGELHAIGLTCHWLALSSRGWRVCYLGPDTPVPAIERAALATAAKAVVLAASMPERFAALAAAPPRLPPETLLAIGGRGASPRVARRLGARLLEDDPLGAAATLTREV